MKWIAKRKEEIKENVVGIGRRIPRSENDR